MTTAFEKGIVRYIVVTMVLLCNFVMYMERVNISLTLAAMVNHTAVPGSNISRSEECNGTAGWSPPPDPSPQLDGPFPWDELVTGQILAAFFYGYICTQIIGGRAGELLNPKYVIGCSLTVAGVTTVVSPVAARWDWTALVAVRVIMGLVLGTVYPSTFVVLRAWIPTEEMNFLMLLSQSGADMANTMTPPMSSAIISSLGWEAVFYIQGSLAFVWAALWLVLVDSSPETHWFISQQERQYIVSSIGDRQARQQPPLPWRQILTSVPVWAFWLNLFGSSWFYYTFLGDLPQYMNNILGEDISTNALLNSLPYLGLFLLTLTYGWVSDLGLRRRWVTVWTIRQTAVTVSQLLPAVLLVVISFLGCRQTATVAILVLTIVLQGAGYSLTCVPLEMAPNFIGTVIGLGNTLGASSGFLAPLVVGALTEGQETLARWRACFLLSAGIAALTWLCFLLGGSVEEQPWNRVTKHSSSKDKDELCLQTQEKQGQKD